MSSYKPRVIDAAIAHRLKNKGAVLVEGAKWCGKKTTCEQHASSILYIGDPDRHFTVRVSTRRRCIYRADNNFEKLIGIGIPFFVWFPFPE
ncbi:MAG: hypothetical protein K6C09_00145 [Oscillospiraceae bacterium]|nr:hypothetical protein [Oscillospiraceae bacterium]